MTELMTGLNMAMHMISELFMVKDSRDLTNSLHEVFLQDKGSSENQFNNTVFKV